MTKFIAIASGKGGTGKTTTAINLATALNSFGRDVIVLDANLSNPNVALHLGLPDVPTTLHNVLSGEDTILEAIYLHPSGLRVIPGSLKLENHSKHKKEIEHAALDLFGKAEIVILDSPAGLSNEVKSVLKASDETIIVTNPETSAVTDSLKTIKLAESLGSVVIGVVVNRVIGDNMDLPLEHIKSALEKPILSVIPEDKHLRKAVSIGHPVIYSHPYAPSSKEFKKLAEMLLD